MRPTQIAARLISDVLSAIQFPKYKKGSGMASDLGFIEFIVDQIENAGEITYKKMFGEYALYSDGKVVALICDDQLFVKPTQAGKSFISNVIEAPPYPGAKLYYRIEDKIEDREWISTLIRLTEEELPEPKLKSLKKKKRRGSK